MPLCHSADKVYIISYILCFSQIESLIFMQSHKSKKCSKNSLLF
ncbi:hypothetical protein HMPREF1548_00652 [Clostridium sp. KLE 1755]|nr:hypothetical protein HMPREF1548_00652 [Clostridium sp. KLE 1755]